MGWLFNIHLICIEIRKIKRGIGHKNPTPLISIFGEGTNKRTKERIKKKKKSERERKAVVIKELPHFYNQKPLAVSNASASPAVKTSIKTTPISIFLFARLFSPQPVHNDRCIVDSDRRRNGPALN